MKGESRPRSLPERGRLFVDGIGRDGGGGTRTPKRFRAPVFKTGDLPISLRLRVYREKDTARRAGLPTPRGVRLTDWTGGDQLCV